jgi:hypothetical protein
MGGADPSGCKLTEDCALIQFQSFFLHSSIYNYITCTFGMLHALNTESSYRIHYTVDAGCTTL